jgi:hypothetical protein
MKNFVSVNNQLPDKILGPYGAVDSYTHAI